MDNKKIVFSSPQGKGTSARSKKCDERWNRVKADVHRYFIDENKTLEDTMALLKDDSPGLAKACVESLDPLHNPWLRTNQENGHGKAR
jgi:hypothetical protein